MINADAPAHQESVPPVRKGMKFQAFQLVFIKLRLLLFNPDRNTEVAKIARA